MRPGPLRPRFLAGPIDGRLDFYESSSRDEIVLEEDFIFRDSRGEIWIAPEGLVYDGASIPSLFWSLVGHPLQARHVPAGGIHDHAYRTGSRLTVDPEVLALELPRLALGSIDEMNPEEVCGLPRVEVLVERDEADYFGLLEPLTATGGNSRRHAWTLYRAVRIGGWMEWNDHVARRARKRVPWSRLPAQSISDSR